MKRIPLAIITLILFITVATCAVGLVMLAVGAIFDYPAVPIHLQRG